MAPGTGRRLLGILLLAACLPAAARAAGFPGRLLVLEKEDHALAFVDPDAGRVVARLDAGGDPHEIVTTPDGRTAYISNYGAFTTPLHTLTVVDLDARRALAPVDLGALRAPHGLAYAGGKVWFTAEGSKAIGRYDPASARVDWVLGVGRDRTHMLVVAADARRIYTADVNSGTVSVLEPEPGADASGWRATAVAVGRGPEGFDVAPDGRELWVANAGDGTVAIVDLATRALRATLDLHLVRANRLRFTPDGRSVLVTDLGNGDVLRLDAGTHAIAARAHLGAGAAGILVSADGTQAWIALSRDNAVARVALATLAVEARIATGRGPDGLAWAAPRNAMR